MLCQYEIDAATHSLACCQTLCAWQSVLQASTQLSITQCETAAEAVIAALQQKEQAEQDLQVVQEEAQQPQHQQLQQQEAELQQQLEQLQQQVRQQQRSIEGDSRKAAGTSRYACSVTQKRPAAVADNTLPAAHAVCWLSLL